MTKLDPGTEVELLRLIQRHDGEWGWYQLDRALSGRGQFDVGVPAALDVLEEQALVCRDGPRGPATTHYSVTEAGIRALSTSKSSKDSTFRSAGDNTDE